MTRGAGVVKRRDVHERALGLLAVRARSRRELERRLLLGGFQGSEVDDELDRLERVGLIDDEAFARQVAQQAFASNKGRRAVASALGAKGVDPGIATACLDELGGDEEERALRLARTKAARMHDADAKKAFQRLSGFLMRRGYPPGTARWAARRALGLTVAD